ncbi:hypothetical protein [Paraburkholderia fungorum]|uniref:Putative tail fiber protein gp53-like C-terminal domain-containing protein n=1 Tax=Paraburkholderia fungorum TaxID=134537 RepID=A0A3R7E3M9_9BURK|nr:hypothetical protein [Paraburkholderia fungorum]RKF36153.1 hypothetical protein BCY88_36780 [Paraburkholderia fungorum]
MTNLVEAEQWEEGIRQFETSDAVMGGPDGVDNIPPRQLANRTTWLRARLQDGGATYAPDTGTKNNIVVNLTPAATQLVEGMEVCFVVAFTNDDACTLTPNGTAKGGIARLPLYGGDHANLSASDLPAGTQVRARFTKTLNVAAGGAWVIQSITGGMARTVTPPVGDMSTRAANMAALFQATDGRQTVDVAGDAAVKLTADQYGVAMLSLAGGLTAPKDLLFPAQTGQWIIENNATGNFNITARVAGGVGVVLPVGSPVIVCSDGKVMKFASAGGQAGFSGMPVTGKTGTSLTIIGGYTPGALMIEKNGAMLKPGTAASPDFIAIDGSTANFAVPLVATDDLMIYVFSTFSVANAVKKSGDSMGGPLALYDGSTAPTPAPGDNSQKVLNTAWFKSEQAAEGNQGTAKVATQPQTNAGIDDTTIVTPKKLRAGFSILLAANGYFAFPSWLGGLILQWGKMTTAIGALGSANQLLPLTFPNTVLIGLCAPIQTGAWMGTNPSIGVTATNSLITVWNNNQTAISPYTWWLAIGY